MPLHAVAFHQPVILNRRSQFVQLQAKLVNDREPPDDSALSDPSRDPSHLIEWKRWS